MTKAIRRLENIGFLVYFRWICIKAAADVGMSVSDEYIAEVKMRILGMYKELQKMKTTTDDMPGMQH